jgi:hypothetical protein
VNNHELERSSEQPMIGGEYENNSSPGMSEEHEQSEEGEEEQEGELQQEEEEEEEGRGGGGGGEEEEEEEEEDDDDEDDDEDDDGNGGNDGGENSEAEMEVEVEVKPQQVEDVEPVEGNMIEEDVAEEEEAEAEVAEVEESVPLTEENHNLTNLSAYRHDLERIPSLNSHRQDPTSPSGTNTLIPVNTSSEHIEPFPRDEMGQPGDTDKWVPVSDYSQHQQEYVQPGKSSLKLPELISQQRGGGVSDVIDLERNVMEMDNGTSIFCPELIPSFQKEPEMLAPSYSHGSLNGIKQQVAGLPSFVLASERPPESLQVV